MTANYTKGEWKVKQYVSPFHRFYVVSDECIETHICKCNGCDTPEANANAQLIAAAPMLYEAISKPEVDELYVELMRTCSPELRLKVAKFFTDLYEAKIKAEGK